MAPCLPKNDPDPARRRAAMESDRERWQFDRTQHGFPLAADVAHGESYSASYLLRAVAAKGELFATRLAASHTDALVEARAEYEALKRAGADPSTASDGTLRERLAAAMDERLYAPMVSVAHVDDYAALFHALPMPATRPFADDDGFFAWQRLAGCNALHLRRQTEADARFPVTEEHFRGASGDGDGLARARAEGRLYVLDLTALEGIATGATLGWQRYCDAPQALFVRALDGAFRPVAVQSKPRPGRHAPVLTPRDGTRWRHARLGVQTADAVWAGAVMHLSICHALAGGVQVCTARELAANHPVRRLLWPHFEMTAAANTTMKTDVIGVGGYFDRLLAPTLEASIDLGVRALRSRSIRDSAPWRDVALRGCDDLEALPAYPLRDDGLPIAFALRTWINAYLALWYGDDADVVSDPELAAWHRSLGDAAGAGLHDVPALTSRADLADLLTTFVFHITAVHASVNYDGYDHYAWPATYPSARWAPTPGPDDEPTEEDLLRALPPLGIADRMLDLTIPQLRLRMNTLGHYAADAFGDPRTAPLVAAFRAELERIEEATAARDAARPWSFPYLLPSRVAQSIHV